jgi:phospholipid-binding lipoprotein MlaA
MTTRACVALVAAFAAIVIAAVPVAADDRPSSGDAASADATMDAAPDYDPWQPFNERMFGFNYHVLDRYVMKPLGRAWDRILPDPVQRSIGDAFDNASMPRRLVNKILQARPRAAGEEIARFAINTTVGWAGLLDIADRLGLHGHDADGGQTFGVWGIGPGPYLVLPFLPPLTVRDAIGYGGDSAMDPIGYLVPVPLAATVATTAVRRVNDRSLQPAAFENIEETVLDLYSAVRNVYLQRRRVTIGRARADSVLFAPRETSAAPSP